MIRATARTARAQRWMSNAAKTEKVSAAPSAPEVIPPTKKKFSFTKFLFRTALAASVVYGGVLYAATKNDKVMDFVLDNELPYSEELIDVIEHGSVDNITRKVDEWKEYLTSFQASSKTQLNEFTSKLEKTGEDLKEKLAPGNLTPAEQLMKPVEVEMKEHESLPLLKSDVSDPSVRATINALNNLIASIDGHSLSKSSAGLVKTIEDSVQGLTARMNALTSQFDEEVAKQVKAAKVDNLSALTQKELEMTQELLLQLKGERAKLEEKLNERLVAEVDATKAALAQAAANAVSMVRIEQTRKFEELVVERVDSERNGRLANVAALESRLGELEEFATSLEKQLLANHEKQQMHHLVVKLRSTLLGSDSASSSALTIAYVDQLAKSDNELIQAVVGDLQPLAADSASILTNAQLLLRWELLVPELRSAALLPPNAGLLGHLTSTFFSKLLFPVKGAKPEGKDIESVVARVESALVRGRLDDAVEEVAHLKGWTRKLADDWVVLARKRLEAEFLLSVIEAETRVL